MKHPDDEAGAVTAEAAVVLPVLVLVAIALCWLVSLGVAEVRAVDAARETARALAREDDAGSAVALGRRVAPEGAEIQVHEDGSTLRVTVRAPVRGPGGLFDFPVFEASATAIAVRETAP